MAKIIEDGIPAGNWYDKYNTKNPIARMLMSNFLKSVGALLVKRAGDIDSICEIGCGEGMLSRYLYGLGITKNMRAFDFSVNVINIAKSAGRDCAINFYQKSIYDAGDEERSDLIVCCEVLEHLEHVEKALEMIQRVTKKYCLLSVPSEPVWRALNIARGKYLKDLGNTPGHINHWSYKAFTILVADYFDVIEMKRPLPWTMVLAKRKDNHLK